MLGGLTETMTFLRRSLKKERNRYRKENRIVERRGVDKKEARRGDSLNGMEWIGLKWSKRKRKNHDKIWSKELPFVARFLHVVKITVGCSNRRK